jgi:hypothetical protein
MLPITQCDIAHRDIGNEKILKTYEQFNHADIHTITTSFCNKLKKLKIATS